MSDFQLTMTPYPYKRSHALKHSVVDVAFFRPVDPWKMPLHSTDMTLQIFSCLFIEGPSESAQKTPRHQILSTKEMHLPPLVEAGLPLDCAKTAGGSAEGL